MSAPALALIPVLADPGTGTGASTRTLDDELLDRATRDDYQQWLGTAMAAGGCVRPIRLHGTIRDIDPATGEILARPGHRRHPGQGDLPAVRGPPGLGLPAVRGDLPGRYLPAHPRRARRRQGRPRIRRDPPVRVRHLHRPLLRPRPHPRRHARRDDRPVPSPPQGQLLPARTPDLLRPAAQRRRRLPGHGRCARTATTTTPPSSGTRTPPSCGGAPSSPCAVAWPSSPSHMAHGSGCPMPRSPSSSAGA